jgi:hypothetical protein
MRRSSYGRRRMRSCTRCERLRVQRVDRSAFRAGTELRWRRSGGHWWSGVRFVLEDAANRQYAVVTYGFWGRPKRITIRGRAYRAQRPGSMMGIRLFDEESGAEAAVLRFKKSSGVITIPGGPTLRCQLGGQRSERTLQILHGEVTAMTITWRPMNLWGSAEGSAIIGDAELGDSTVLVACLAFHYFIPRSAGAR